MKEDKILLPSEVTEHHLLDWKKRYGRVFEVNSEDGKKAWLRKPDRLILSSCKKRANNDEDYLMELLARACFLAGDIGIIEDEACFLGLKNVLLDIIEVKLVELKEV